MKKILVFTFFFTFVIIESSYGQIRLKFSSGINKSNCTFENLEVISPKARMGYFLGIAPNYQINNRMQVQVGFQYSLKGYDTRSPNTVAPSWSRYEYLDILPEIEFYFLEHLAIGVGVNYGIKLNEQLRFGEENGSSAEKPETIKSTDFGLIGKLEYNYKSLFGFVRYNIGIKDIAATTFTDENGQDIFDLKQFNRNLQIGIGYQLSFNKN